MTKSLIKGAAAEVLDYVISCSREQFRFQTCPESEDGSRIFFVTGDWEFETAGAVILTALDWKLILVTGR